MLRVCGAWVEGFGVWGVGIQGCRVRLRVDVMGPSGFRVGVQGNA